MKKNLLYSMKFSNTLITYFFEINKDDIFSI